MFWGYYNSFCAINFDIASVVKFSFCPVCVESLKAIHMKRTKIMFVDIAIP